MSALIMMHVVILIFLPRTKKNFPLNKTFFTREIRRQYAKQAVNLASRLLALFFFVCAPKIHGVGFFFAAHHPLRCRIIIIYVVRDVENFLISGTH